MADTYTPAEMAAAILAIPGGGNEMPTGAVMHYAGLSAPDGWLECDGTVYNIADHPALAAFFAANYGASNYWGGDGTTTFGVPDWRGEFLRGAGTNAHANQGSGAAVGEHQDATEIPNVFSGMYGTANALVATKTAAGTFNIVRNGDSYSTAKSGYNMYCAPSNTDAYAFESKMTQRPTNTSLLVCIKT